MSFGGIIVSNTTIRTNFKSMDILRVYSPRARVCRMSLTSSQKNYGARMINNDLVLLLIYV